MSTWIALSIVLLLVVLARYALRRAIAAFGTLTVLAILLFFVGRTPDEGADFSGEESIIGMAVFTISLAVRETPY